MALALCPISFAEATAFITTHHRHHLPSVGWKFGIAVTDGVEIRGVVSVGRPVARAFDDQWTLEITRCCTDGTKNAASMLYGAARRAAQAMGYRRLVTYTLASESGTSLIASGYTEVWKVKGRSWSCKSRPRVDVNPTVDKTLWEVSL